MIVLLCEFLWTTGIVLDVQRKRGGLADLSAYSDPGERPTAETLLRAPFCIFDPNYNFLDTDLYAKIRGAF